MNDPHAFMVITASTEIVGKGIFGQLNVGFPARYRLANITNATDNAPRQANKFFHQKNASASNARIF